MTMLNPLQDAVRRLARERNAVILAHNYQVPEIQDVADFVGDSLGLAIEARKTDAPVIVMCGVYFMAETAKIVNPERVVLSPDPTAGCSLADSITLRDLRQWKAEYPGAVVVNGRDGELQDPDHQRIQRGPARRHDRRSEPQGRPPPGFRSPHQRILIHGAAGFAGLRAQWLVADLRLGDSVSEAERDGQERGEKPQAPPERTPLPLHHLIAAETAEAVERSRHATTPCALVQLQAAVGAAHLFRGVVQDHRGLVAPRAQARRDERERREFHISLITGITIGRRRVRL